MSGPAIELTGSPSGVTCLDNLYPVRQNVVDFQPGIPRYIQIAGVIRGDLKGEGERIASEHELCARFGAPTVAAGCEELMNRVARRLRDALARLPDGRHEAEGLLLSLIHI